jgi:hypothetical protein
MMKRRRVDVSFNHINLSIATQTRTMAEQPQGLGGTPAMSGASSAHHPVVETDDGNELEKARIDLESAFANSHESSESSSNDKTPSRNADGSKCEKILELNQNSLKLLLVMAVGCVKNDVTAYHICNGTIGILGASTAFHQQWHLLCLAGQLNQNPSKIFILDLITEIHKWQVTGVDTILGGGFNERFGETQNSLAHLVTTYGLANVHASNHGTRVSRTPTVAARKELTTFSFLHISWTLSTSVVSTPSLRSSTRITKASSWIWTSKAYLVANSLPSFPRSSEVSPATPRIQVSTSWYSTTIWWPTRYSPSLPQSLRPSVTFPLYMSLQTPLWPSTSSIGASHRPCSLPRFGVAASHALPGPPLVPLLAPP